MELNKEQCLVCGKELKPDKEAKNDNTGKWDEHTYFLCDCTGEVENKDIRVSIG